jgi:CRP-like cAMP-binding protein
MKFLQIDPNLKEKPLEVMFSHGRESVVFKPGQIVEVEVEAFADICQEDPKIVLATQATLKKQRKDVLVHIARQLGIETVPDKNDREEIAQLIVAEQNRRAGIVEAPAEAEAEVSDEEENGNEENHSDDRAGAGAGQAD